MTIEELKELKEKVQKLKKVNQIEDLIPKESAYSFLYVNNKDRLDSIAMNYLGRKYTYMELFDKIDIAAKGFANMGVKPGDHVSMAMLTTPESIISFYALNKLGALIYMVNATHDKSAIHEELVDAESKVLVINDIFYDKDIKKFGDEVGIKHIIASSLDDSFPEGFIGDRIKFKIVKAVKSIGNAVNSDSKCVRWNKFLSESKNLDLNLTPYYEPNMSAVIAATSGSTGKPKKPLMTNENLNAMVLEMGMTCRDFLPNDSIFTTLPIWIFYSLFNSIHEPLCLGVTVDIDPLFDSKKVSKRLNQYRFNHWNTIPAYVEDMINDKKIKNMDLSFLKTITTGGDYRTPKLKEEGENILLNCNSNVEIGQGYGASECGGSFCYTYEPNMPAETIGKPLVSNAFKIVDLDTGKILGPNEKGELYFYTPTLMKEYYKDSELTNKTIITDEDGIRWYKTEDIAHYNEKGELYIDGRIRRVEITRDGNGMPTKMFPDKVKQVVSLHPSIEQCEIVMIPDEKRITRPVAYIVMKDGQIIDEKVEMEINDICVNKNVDQYTIPTEYITIDEMPRTASLKIDLNKLKEMYMETQSNEKSTKKYVFRRN